MEEEGCTNVAIDLLENYTSDEQIKEDYGDDIIILNLDLKDFK